MRRARGPLGPARAGAERSLELVLIDALGTLIELEPPGPALAEALRERGIEVSRTQAEEAFAVEIAHYRANHLRARDGQALAALRLECAAVLHAELPARAREAISPRELLPLMLGALRFEAYPDAIPALVALRGRGLRVLALSNWDISLHEVLARVGLATALDGVLTSAEAGAAKPDGRIFAAALELAGVEAGRALHVGDAPHEDVQGALAAGIRPVLLARGGALGRGPAVQSIESLSELAGLLAAG